MENKHSVIRSLGTTFALFLVLQIAFYAAVHILLFPGNQRAWYFYPSAVGYHLFFFYIIMQLREHMVFTETGKAMQKLNLSNKLTLFRLSSLPTVGFLFVWSKGGSQLILLPLLGLTIAAFLTDLLDGYLARKTGQITTIGKMLDSGSDYLVLFILTLIFWTFQTFPLWLFITIVIRFTLQLLGVVFTNMFQRGRDLGPTFLGKASFFAMMVLYAMEIGGFLIDSFRDSWILHWSEIITGVIIWVSVVDKFWYFWGPKKSSQNSSNLQE